MFSSTALFPSLEPVASPNDPAAARGTVLLVEDEEALASLLTHLLRRIKLQVLCAADGAAALRLFAEHRASILMAFVDCNLPDMAGGDLCQELRLGAPRLPLLLTSGRDQHALQHVLAVGGPCSFLPKPYMPADVMRRVTELLPVAG